MGWLIAIGVVVFDVVILLFNRGADRRHRDPEYQKRCDDLQEEAIREMMESKKK